MYLNNYQYLKNQLNIKIIFLILFSILIRIPVILLTGDTILENEWGDIVNNLIINKTLSFNYNDPDLNKFLLPNVWMPPLYAYYLYFFSFLNLDEHNYVQVILLSQIFLSSIAIVIFYKINKIFFSEKISFYSSIIFSLFPLYLYSCGQISSITLQVFLTILFFYYVLQITKNSNFYLIFFISLTSGLLMLLRGEFILLLSITFFYLFFYFKIKIKNILLMALIILLTISPYLIRNIIVVDKIVITKSFGYNLWKGNNPNSTVEGGLLIDSNLKAKIDKISKDKSYGINFDKIFLDKAIENIINEPSRYLILFIKKFISFIFIDINSSQKDYFRPLHYIPCILVGITSTLGIILSHKKSRQLNYLILMYFLNILIFACFFILPRYKLVILPIQLILTNILLKHILDKFVKKNE
jgi:4-amino-4-deoxy-L-arabinose transferase-like glycosyltransferase